MVQERMEAVRGVRTDLSVRDARAIRRRRIDERFYIRFPAVFRLLADRVMRLPPRSRLRRLILARTFRGTYAAGNRQDFAALRVGLDPAFEYRPPPDLTGLDQDPVFYGREAHKPVWRQWFDAFEDLRLEPEELLDFGDKVLVTAHFSGRGAHSGVTVRLNVFQLYNLRRGIAVKQTDSWSARRRSKPPGCGIRRCRGRIETGL